MRWIGKPLLHPGPRFSVYSRHWAQLPAATRSPAVDRLASLPSRLDHASDQADQFWLRINSRAHRPAGLSHQDPSPELRSPGIRQRAGLRKRVLVHHRSHRTIFYRVNKDTDGIHASWTSPGRRSQPGSEQLACNQPEADWLPSPTISARLRLVR